MNRVAPGLFASLVLAACGASAPSAPVSVARAPSGPVGGEALVDASGEGMGVEGLNGSLSPREARQALRPYMAEITGCFAMRSMSFEELGGSLQMRIRVSDAGRVLAAHPEDSTVGDREVENCVSHAIESARFPRPHGGGEAEVHWSLSVDPPESAREPTTWDPSRVARVVRRRARRARNRCEIAEDVQVTAYVSRRGRVVSAGAATTTEEDAARLDCVAEQVRRWPMPRAARLAKVTFDLT